MLKIELSDICKTYDDSGNRREIFKGLNACFDPGRIFVIIGRSGVGKSSLLNLISGIDLPDKGTVTIGGTSISGLDDTGRTIFRRRSIGFVYQFFNLVPVLTVRENVTLIGELDGMPLNECRDRADAFLSRVGLYDRRNHFPDRLSGGEQQRVAIVRAIVNDPEILLADEPTGNLDQETGKLILDMLCDLAAADHKTLIMVTHSPEAMAYAHEVLSVENRVLVPHASGQAVS